ncbi:polysaccharide deacetylase [Leucobacter muris]|uniref:Polysaccharide deacetylase n=1 Tax=Leucobacter muris TaxID=1935379 RepID=A0ABX5QC27_9MICO|nr:polysaccharide deacetylase [Leucobacter muris]QAB16615.1 polysaccharide deacetylase [Leucobacter muris]
MSAAADRPHARAPLEWPGGARCAASFSFDVDGESAALAAAPGTARSLSVMTHQAYGPRVGVGRLLDILDRVGVRSTFFVPGFTAELHPGAVRDIAAAGHEIAHHGYHHVRPAGLDPEQQAEQLDRGSDALERLTGDRPLGYRAPMWDLSWEMPALLAERGFLYDSSLMDDDFPYVLSPGEQGAAEGARTLVEIPIQWALDDWEQYCFLPDVTELGPIQTPAHAVELWRSELDGMREHGGCWVLTNHPFLSGRPGRAAVLERFMADVATMSDVWIAPLGEIARRTVEQAPAPRGLPRIEP